MATAANFDDPEQGTIRAELKARIDQLDRDFRLLSLGELGRRTDAIRNIARSNGFDAAAKLAGGLGDSIARDGRAAIVRPYLDGLRDAIECAPGDTRAGDIVLASVSVRLAG